MIIRCCSCGKQVVSYAVPIEDKYCTISQGAKAAFKSNECYCGYCAAELNEDGLFPEEVEYEILEY